MTLTTVIAINLALGGPVFFGLIKLLTHGILAADAPAPSAEAVLATERLAA